MDYTFKFFHSNHLREELQSIPLKQIGEDTYTRNWSAD